MDILETLEEKLRERCPELHIKVNESMARHTTFRVGGAVKLMALPTSLEQTTTAIRCAVEYGVEPLFIGNGSNLLVSDRGIDGFVIKVSNGFDQSTVDGTRMTVSSGVTLAKLAQQAQKAGLTGLEFAHGIPGTLGGAITMNAGAYGGEICDVIESVTLLTAEGDLVTMMKSEIDFAYRHSSFSDGSRLIVGATLQLEQGDSDNIRFRMAELSKQRVDKQPLDKPNAGSTFKRPEGYFAAALIDQCGLKGFSVGGAMVSPKHAGFVVNNGNATCEDIMNLVEHVKDKVKLETNVELELEIKLLGE